MLEKRKSRYTSFIVKLSSKISCVLSFIICVFFQDAWLDSIEKNPMYMGRSAANDTEMDDDSGNEKAGDDLSQDEIGVRKRRIANVLEPGETVRLILRFNKFLFQT